MGGIGGWLQRFLVHDPTGLEPRIVTLDSSIKMLGMAVDTDARSVYRDVPRLGKAYTEHKDAHGIPHKKEPWIFVAVSKDYDPEAKSFTYMMGDVVTSLEEVPEGLEGFEIPAGRYAVFPVQPKVRWGWGAAITRVKQYAFTEWLPASGYEAGGAVDDFEWHDARSTRAQDPEIDLYVAIHERDEADPD